MSKHLVFIGAPGAGKGTISKQLENKYTQLSTGDMLRTEIKKGTELGKKVANLIDNGNFVDDVTMFNIIQANLPEGQSLIFDGYPRNVSQIEYFKKLVPNKEDVTVVYFNVDLELLEDRVVNRSTCVSCGEIHNTKTNKPTEEGTCNKCGGELNKRKDDNSTAFVHRLNIFKNDTLPIVNHFKTYPDYHEVDASGTPEEVLELVKKVLGE